VFLCNNKKSGLNTKVMWGVGNSKIDKKDGAEGFFMENPFCSERNRNSLTPQPLS
jgi:hypothetical protein